MASSLTDLRTEVGKLQGLLQESQGCTTWGEAVRITASEVRRIIDELLEPPDLTWKKEKALMFAMERVIGGIQLGLSLAEEHERTARILEAAKRIHRAVNQEELNQGLDDLLK